MSDYYETSLRQYEEELDQQYREEYEQAQNPKVSWFVITPDWEEWADSEEEKNALIKAAKDDGLRYSCTQHIEGEKY